MSEARPQPAKQRSRKNTKHLHATVRAETYQYVSELAGELSLGQGVEVLVEFHKKRGSDKNETD